MGNTKLRRCLALLCLALLLMAGCGASPATATPAPAASPARMSASPPTELPEEGSSFSVHFIDVGQADAALVECDGHFMLIDGGTTPTRITSAACPEPSIMPRRSSPSAR